MIHPLNRSKRSVHLTICPSSGASTSDTPLTPGAADSRQLSQHSTTVTGPPSRHHWKPDSEAAHCEYFDCTTWFGIFNRRHHCRRCGEIYCAQHCSNYLRLDQTCQFHRDGALCRGCDTCISDFHTWTKTIDERSLQPTTTTSSSFATCSRPSSASATCQKQSSSSSTATSVSSSSMKRSTFSKRHPGIMMQLPQNMEGIVELSKEDIVTPTADLPQPRNMTINMNAKREKKNDTAFCPIPSVPADWQWSTF
ncbi:hypothetical protein BCR42DRAFT_417026 [Absidia repens]|uniref:FYVE-type domain-containing protein n=1 Tax=Absidia repens TaxID=90262 RepID=A0A1X2IES6_9FUNG|nr:hypothetical protein BCR42DRAFT_417026 [Absidia repens]